MSSETANPWMIPKVDDRSATARRARMEILAEWSLTPPTMRPELGMPATQGELAALFGVSGGAVSQWRKTVQFQRIMSSNLRAVYSTERLAHVIENMHSIAVGSTPQAVAAARTLLAWVKEAEADVDPQRELEELSDDELAALYEAMEKRRVPSKGASKVPAPRTTANLIYT